MPWHMWAVPRVAHHEVAGPHVHCARTKLSGMPFLPHTPCPLPACPVSPDWARWRQTARLALQNFTVSWMSGAAVMPITHGRAWSSGNCRKQHGRRLERRVDIARPRSLHPVQPRTCVWLPAPGGACWRLGHRHRTAHVLPPPSWCPQSLKCVLGVSEGRRPGLGAITAASQGPQRQEAGHRSWGSSSGGRHL